MREYALENLTVQSNVELRDETEGRGTDELVDSRGNLVCLDRIFGNVVFAPDFVILIDKPTGFIGGNLALDVSFRGLDEVVRRLEPIDILKADGRRSAVRAFAAPRLFSFVVLVKVVHPLHLLVTKS